MFGFGKKKVTFTPEEHSMFEWVNEKEERKLYSGITDLLVKYFHSRMKEVIDEGETEDPKTLIAIVGRDMARLVYDFVNEVEALHTANEIGRSLKLYILLPGALIKSGVPESMSITLGTLIHKLVEDQLAGETA